MQPTHSYLDAVLAAGLKEDSNKYLPRSRSPAFARSNARKVYDHDDPPKVKIAQIGTLDATDAISVIGATPVAFNADTPSQILEEMAEKRASFHANLLTNESSDHVKIDQSTRTSIISADSIPFPLLAIGRNHLPSEFGKDNIHHTPDEKVRQFWVDLAKLVNKWTSVVETKYGDKKLPEREIESFYREVRNKVMTSDDIAHTGFNWGLVASMLVRARLARQHARKALKDTFNTFKTPPIIIDAANDRFDKHLVEWAESLHTIDGKTIADFVHRAHNYPDADAEHVNGHVRWIARQLAHWTDLDVKNGPALTVDAVNNADNDVDYMRTKKLFREAALSIS
jgi:hypothetical protein